MDTRQGDGGRLGLFGSYDCMVAGVFGLIPNRQTQPCGRVCGPKRAWRGARRSPQTGREEGRDRGRSAVQKNSLLANGDRAGADFRERSSRPVAAMSKKEGALSI